MANIHIDDEHLAEMQRRADSVIAESAARITVYLPMHATVAEIVSKLTSLGEQNQSLRMADFGFVQWLGEKPMIRIAFHGPTHPKGT